MKNGWLVKTPAKSFAVYAATSTEKKEWMLHIQRCIQDLLLKSQSSFMSNVDGGGAAPVDHEFPLKIGACPTKFCLKPGNSRSDRLR